MDQLITRLEEFDILSDDVVDKLASIDWQTKIEENIKTIFSGIGNIVEIIITTVTSVISGVTTAFLAIIFSIYILLGKDKLGSQCKRLMNRYLSENKCQKINYGLSVFNGSFHRFIVGQCTEAVILGVLCAIGMLILRLPYAPMIGAVVGFTSLIPIVGAFIGGAVGAFLIFMQSPTQALIFIVFLIILQQIEGDLIYPHVVGSSIGLPGIWVLAAVTIGGGVFGIWGMLLAVPIAAAIYTLVKNDLNKSKAAKTKITEAEAAIDEKAETVNSTE